MFEKVSHKVCAIPRSAEYNAADSRRLTAKLATSTVGVLDRRTPSLNRSPTVQRLVSFGEDKVNSRQRPLQVHVRRRRSLL